MKKIFTLLFSTAMLSTAFAQYGQNEQRNRHDDDVIVYNNNRGYDKHDKDCDTDGHGYDKHDKGYGRGAYIFSAREKDIQINQINRQYDYKIQDVRNRFGMGWYQKKRIIYNLEAQRDEEIAMVWHKFKSSKNKFGDYGRRNNDRRW